MDNSAYHYSDRELLSLTDSLLREADPDHMAAVVADREQAWQAWRGEIPKPMGEGSKYVSRDLFDAIDAIQSYFAQIFSGNRTPVRFRAKNETAVEIAEPATAFVRSLFHGRLSGSKVLSDVLFDALLLKIGAVKLYPSVTSEPLYSKFEGWAEEQLLALPPGLKVAWFEVENDLYSGELVEYRNTISLHADAIRAEDLLLAMDEEDPPLLIGHKAYLRRGDLTAQGYPENLVEKAPSATIKNTQRSKDRKEAHPNAEELDLILVYDFNVRLDMDGDGILELWRIVRTKDDILFKSREQLPLYHTWSPYRTPGKHFEMSLADLLYDAQRARTVMIRGVLENVVMNNHQQLSVTRSMLDAEFAQSSLEALQRNRPRALVYVNNPQAIQPITQNPMPPGIFDALNLLAEEKEQRIGYSRVAQGLNQEAISVQNAASLIERYAQFGQQRVAKMARSFAEDFYRPLMEDVLRTALTYLTPPDIVSIEPSFANINPALWSQADMRLEVDVALVPEEQSREIASLLALDSKFLQDRQLDPQAAWLYQPANRHALLAMVAERLSVPKRTILTAPTDPEYVSAAQAAAQAQAGAQQQAAEQSQLAAQMAQAQLQLAARQLEIQQAEKAAKIALEREELAHKIEVDAIKLNKPQLVSQS